MLGLFGTGLQAFHMDDAVVRAKRAMMAAAHRSCLLVNHQRFGRSALHVLADLTEFDAIIKSDVERYGKILRDAGITPQ